VIHFEVVVAIGVLAGLWVGAWRAHGGPLPLGRAVAFAAGLGALGVALIGPLHRLAEASIFAAHMTQHLLLTLVVPPCLLAGTPGFMADAAVAGVLRLGPAARLARLVTRPVPALGLHAVALVVWHLPGTYRLALDSHAWHFAQHASLAGTALLAWWPVLSAARALPPLPFGAQILYLFILGMPMTIVAAMITGAEQVLYPTVAAHPLEDQRLGGLLMWVPAGIVPLVAFSVVFYRWVAAEWDEAGEPPPLAPRNATTGIT
jgi:putative membrane protein